MQYDQDQVEVVIARAVGAAQNARVSAGSENFALAIRRWASSEAGRAKISSAISRGWDEQRFSERLTQILTDGGPELSSEDINRALQSCICE